MRFSLWRILGNDLPPRHAPTQTEDNLRFILDSEPPFEDCEKCFLLNRIIDPKKVEMYVDLIQRAGYNWYSLPFQVDEFRKLGGSRLQATMYLTNVNPARNHCIEWGLSRADYVLPFDGGSYFREDGWKSFEASLALNPDDAFWALPQWRVPDYNSAIDCTVLPQVREEYYFGNSRRIGLRELAIVFSKKSDIRFNNDLCYACVDKVELLWRLGLSGLWDMWEPDFRKRALQKMSKYADTVKMGGFLCRLPSGNPAADGNNQIRGKQRSEGMELLLKQALAYIGDSG